MADDNRPRAAVPAITPSRSSVEVVGVGERQLEVRGEVREDWMQKTAASFQTTAELLLTYNSRSCLPTAVLPVLTTPTPRHRH
jgi:hypothetical protein